jgi:hypothetical protein
MPAGCKECAPGDWQCGSDVTELCGGAAGWTPAGALCLQLFVRKHPVSGNCLVRVELKPLAQCGAPLESEELDLTKIVTQYVAPPIASARKMKTAAKKPASRKK